MRALLVAAGVLLMMSVGCAQPARPPAGAEQPQVKVAEPPPPASKCEPGKEEWRSAAQPIRGGRLVKQSN